MVRRHEKGGSPVASACSRAQVNTRYCGQLQQVLTWRGSMGIVGGRPSSSLYFVGTQAERVLYLDPHDVQDVRALPLADAWHSFAPALATAFNQLRSLSRARIGTALHATLAAWVWQRMHACPLWCMVRRCLPSRGRCRAGGGRGRRPGQLLLQRAAPHAARRHRPLARARLLLPHAGCAPQHTPPARACLACAPHGA